MGIKAWFHRVFHLHQWLVVYDSHDEELHGRLPGGVIRGYRMCKKCGQVKP